MRSISLLVIFLLSFTNCYTFFNNLTTSHLDNIQIMEEFSPLNAEKLDINFYDTNDVLGEIRSFWIYDYDLGDISIQAKLLSIGNYCYIYMDQRTISDIGNSAATSKCNRLRDEFDATIYPKGIEMAGNVDGRLGDVDGDPKVTVLLTPIDPYGGYYHFEDDSPTASYSNHREMVYVNSESDIVDIIKTTAHEFNHLIWGNYEQDEAYFLTEGTANYALYYSGFLSNDSYITVEPDYNLCAETHMFSFHPETSLLNWHFFDDEIIISDYGQAYMFIYYLAEKYGQDLILDLVMDVLDGTRSIDHVLAAASYNITFNDLYLDWITACTIDEISFDNGLYGFEDATFTMKKTDSIVWSLPTTFMNRRFSYYGFTIQKVLSPPDEFTAYYTNPPFPYYLGQSIVVKDENGWSVTQSLQRNEGDTIPLYISGNTIDYVYIITSLMLSTTPTDFMFEGIYYAQDKSVLLNCTFLEGFIPPSTSKASISSAYMSYSLFSIFIGIRILLIKSNRKKISTHHFKN